MIEKKLAELSRIFHSEADFQHALAWKLHQHHQDAMIRLEKRIEPSTAADHLEELYVDLWFKPKETPIPIELKYKTVEFWGRNEDEVIELRSQGAHPPNRFDVVADIERIEAIVESSTAEVGYVIIITNDPAYWRAPTQKDVIDADFRLHGEVGGTPSWADRTSEQTKTKKRDRVIELRNEYTLDWKPYDYDQLTEVRTGNSDFRYLVIEVH